MVIRILDVVPDCNSWGKGEMVFEAIQEAFKNGSELVVSFEGVDDVPSAFVNAAFLPLLDTYDFAEIKKRLKFVDSTRQINDMIRRRFSFEATKRVQPSFQADIKRRA
jgi:hypothetical protein